MPRLAALALALVSYALPAAAEAPPLKTYASERWGFTALFPWQPKESAPQQGEGVTVSSGNPEDTIAYMISVTPIAPEIIRKKGIPKILDDAVKGAVDNVHGTVLEQHDVKIDGYPGREVVISGGGFLANCRVYIVRERMYLPMVIYQPSLVLPVSPAAFHAGFRLARAKR